MTRGSTSFERKDGEAFQNFVGFGTVISELLAKCFARDGKQRMKQSRRMGKYKGSPPEGRRLHSEAGQPFTA
jgi:hypothetical protein